MIPGDPRTSRLLTNLGSYIRALQAERLSASEFDERFQPQNIANLSPRLVSAALQLYAEVTAWHGLDEIALRYIDDASQLVLVDLDWLDHCPLLARLRERDAFIRIRERVHERTEAIWEA
jgi:serine/threonine-protein kinase